MPAELKMSRWFYCMSPLALWLFPCAVLAAEPAVDFEKQIRPMFADQCVSCHGPEKQKGDLRLDVKDLALDGGTTGKSILPGKGEASLLIKRMRGVGDDDQMPLKKDPLSNEQIAIVSRWIDQGAKWPEGGAAITVAKHWSFIAPVRPADPVVKNTAWVRNSIDRFVLAKLEGQGMTPSPEAAKETLLRRVSLDLTGLPPSPAELDAFLSDPSANAYEKAVDRLLASPHYGERWARHWLDGARYADSNGYSQDNPRTIWPYRDWVVRALNKDMPFDEFTIEQLAGDLLPNATIDQKIATGFHRNTQINEEGGTDPEQFRVEAVIDRVGTTGTVFMGLTVGCAQCHNHKFDPISQREFYRIFAFFNSCDEPKLAVPAAIDEHHRGEVQTRLKVLEADLKKARDAAAPREAAWEAALTDVHRAALSAPAKAALNVPAGKRNAKQRSALVEAMLSSEPDYSGKLRDYTALLPEADGVTTLVVAERPQPRDSFIFIKGDFTRHSDPVTPGTPAILPPLKVEKPTRVDLAKWIVSPDNPLTARVQVNRLWLQYFGKGLVETENDFGTQGSRPTNPDLLDWLATELIRQHWSLKSMHRLIVTSATYRQGSRVTPELLDKDPYNRLLARQARVRLDAEVVRDAELVASGLFSDKVGGPSVFPPQPEGVLNVGQIRRIWKTSTGADRYRRGLYTWVWRLTPHPQLTSFDAPDATLTCTRRNRSNTPLQALTLLNDAAFVEFAQGMAHRLIKEGPPDDAGRIAYGFRLCTSRKLSAEDGKVLLDVLVKERAAYLSSPTDAKTLCGDKLPANMNEPEFAAWVMVSRVMLNLDEAITRE